MAFYQQCYTRGYNTKYDGSRYIQATAAYPGYGTVWTNTDMKKIMLQDLETLCSRFGSYIVNMDIECTYFIPQWKKGENVLGHYKNHLDGNFLDNRTNYFIHNVVMNDVDFQKVIYENDGKDTDYLVYSRFKDTYVQNDRQSDTDLLWNTPLMSSQSVISNVFLTKDKGFADSKVISFDIAKRIVYYLLKTSKHMIIEIDNDMAMVNAKAKSVLNRMYQCMPLRSLEYMGFVTCLNTYKPPETCRLLFCSSEVADMVRKSRLEGISSGDTVFIDCTREAQFGCQADTEISQLSQKEQSYIAAIASYIVGDAGEYHQSDLKSLIPVQNDLKNVNYSVKFMAGVYDLLHKQKNTEALIDSLFDFIDSFCNSFPEAYRLVTPSLKQTTTNMKLVSKHYNNQLFCAFTKYSHVIDEFCRLLSPDDETYVKKLFKPFRCRINELIPVYAEYKDDKDKKDIVCRVLIPQAVNLYKQMNFEERTQFSGAQFFFQVYADYGNDMDIRTALCKLAAVQTSERVKDIWNHLIKSYQLAKTIIFRSFQLNENSNILDNVQFDEYDCIFQCVNENQLCSYASEFNRYNVQESDEKLQDWMIARRVYLNRAVKLVSHTPATITQIKDIIGDYDDGIKKEIRDNLEKYFTESMQSYENGRSNGRSIDIQWNYLTELSEYWQNEDEYYPFASRIIIRLACMGYHFENRKEIKEVLEHTPFSVDFSAEGALSIIREQTYTDPKLTKNARVKYTNFAKNLGEYSACQQFIKEHNEKFYPPYEKYNQTDTCYDIIRKAFTSLEDREEEIQNVCNKLIAVISVDSNEFYVLMVKLYFGGDAKYESFHQMFGLLAEYRDTKKKEQKELYKRFTGEITDKVEKLISAIQNGNRFEPKKHYYCVANIINLQLDKLSDSANQFIKKIPDSKNLSQNRGVETLDIEAENYYDLMCTVSSDKASMKEKNTQLDSWLKEQYEYLLNMGKLPEWFRLRWNTIEKLNKKVYENLKENFPNTVQFLNLYNAKLQVNPVSIGVCKNNQQDFTGSSNDYHNQG